ncbi:MAG: SUMF1/EgtB/PvdO family nonheme iron enzyme [Spirochaetales bacterium]|uniref:SUMF1/EgtB/PvdO family nonheme iron enzyme n=1 Tax=Candidatus Thalassospirochaeta sargassi TaxID=3119039 RepID=A0AAJ1IJ44_9SPIO|nr:SUMF1/EgtB/PvdO family nonheme iron enzyme [Spirochaetales bacterium]
MKISYLRFFLLLILATSCSYEYFNPVDVESPEYQGFLTTEDKDNIALIPDDETCWCIFRSNIIFDATAYQLQISNIEDFSGELLFNKDDFDSNVMVPLHDFIVGEIYYYRVRALKDGSWGVWSDIGEVSFVNIITNAVPAEGDSYLDRTPEFSWDAVDGADYYEIQTADTKSELDTAVSKIVFLNNFTPNEALAVDQLHYWRVRVVNSEGQVSAWSLGSFNIEEIELVPVSGGSFIMGDEEWASPLHEVTVSGFEIGKYEITWEQWSEVYEWAIANGYNFQNSGSYYSFDFNFYNGLPAKWINWRDAVVWCNALSEFTGLEPSYTYDGAVVTDSSDDGGFVCDNSECNWSGEGYRLPTEAEWEFAARGGGYDTDGLYAGSNDVYTVAWYGGNSSDGSHPVGGKEPNELGIYDMSGNVEEFCWDWYDFYSDSPQTDPIGAESGSGRIIRGGSAWDATENLRVGMRNYSPTYNEVQMGGIRVCRN